MTALNSKREEARQFVQPLVDLAFSDSGAAEAAAQVLLGCYDGSSYHICVRDLCALDTRLYQVALFVISLRVNDGIESHELFDDHSIFPRLAKRWKEQLHIHYRGQP